jgi:hypothetical protein
MTITELIAALEAVRDVHGDLPVLVYNLRNEERLADWVEFLPAECRQETAQPRCDAVTLRS